MPARENQSLFRFRGWEGGLNRDFNEILLSESEIPAAFNVDFDEKGGISKRKGYTKWSTSDPAGMNYGVQLFHYRKLGGSDYLVYVDVDGELYFENASTGTTLARANDGVNITVGTDVSSAVSFDDVFYITSRGTNQGTWTYNGTSWVEITDFTLNGGGTEFPRARKIVNLHERIFACNVVENSGTFSSRIWYSDAGAAQTWQSTSWIDFDPDDGTVIRDAVPLGEKLIVFKDSSFFAMSGVDNLSFTVFPISSSEGTFAQRTAVTTQGVLIWFDTQTGVWAFDGASFRTVDSKMNNRILDGLDSVDFLANPNAANAFYREGKYYLSLAWTDGGGGSDTFAKHMFVWDLRNDTWTEYDFGVQSVARIENTFYAVGPSSGSTPPKGVFQLFNGTTDNTVNIDSEFETPWFAPQDGFVQEHRLRKLQLYVTGASTNPATMTIELFTDFDASTVVASTTQSASSTNYIATSELSGWDVLASAFKIKISNDSDDDWGINGMDVLFSTRLLSRGDKDG